MTVAWTPLLALSAHAQFAPVEDRIFFIDGSDSADAATFDYQLAILRWMKLTNDVRAPGYDPTQPDGNFACSGGDVYSLLICDRCMSDAGGGDCNVNGVADTCDFKTFLNFESPVFSPFANSGFLAQHTFTGWPHPSTRWSCPSPPTRRWPAPPR